MRCPNCGSRSFAVDAIYSATDYVQYHEDSEPSDYDVVDTKHFDGEWPDNATFRCTDCQHESTEATLITETPEPNIRSLYQFENMRAIGEPHPKTRYLGTLRVLGVPMHVELIQVKENDDGVQFAVQENLEEEINALGVIDNRRSRATINHDDREYVFLAYPYSR